MVHQSTGGAARPPARMPALLRRLLPLLVLVAIVLGAWAVLTASPATRDAGNRFLDVFRAGKREPLDIIAVSLPQPPGVDVQTARSTIVLTVPDGQEVATKGDAQDRVDFNVRSPRRQSAPRTTVFVDQTGTVRFDRAALEKTLVAAGLPLGVRIPSELDTPIDARVTAGVRFVWNEPEGPLTLWIARNPRFYTQQGPAWEELRGRLIQSLLLLQPETGRQLQAVRDWDNTFVVPVLPGATSRRVRADGTENALLIEREGRSTLVWQRFGVVHLLDGYLPGRSLMQIADGLR